jgi:hypothetical protein
MESVPNLMLRPDLLILGLFGLIIALVIFFGALYAFVPKFAARQFVREILATPVIQERIKADQQLNVVELINQIIDRIEQEGPTKTRTLTKIIQDITWDMSGVIALIVTLVVMVMVVTKNYEGIPREVFAGWTMILGYYFGKAARR